MLSDIRKMMSRLELLQRHLACSRQAGHKPVANGLKQCSKLHGRCPLATHACPVSILMPGESSSDASGEEETRGHVISACEGLEKHRMHKNADSIAYTKITKTM